MNVSQPTLTDQIKKMQHNRILLTLLLLLFVCVFLWIIAELFSSQQTSTITPELKKQAKQLTPTFDESVFADLEQKRMYQESELSNFTIYRLFSDKRNGIQKIVPVGTDVEELSANRLPPPPTASPSATPEGTQSAGLTQTPPATNSAVPTLPPI